MAPLAPGELETQKLRSRSISEQHYPQMKEIRALIQESARLSKRGTASRFLGFCVSLAITGLALMYGIVGVTLMIISYPLIFVNEPFVLRWYGYIAGFIWYHLQIMYERFSGLRVTISGLNDIPYGENSYLISNHVCFADWACINALAMRKGMLPFCKYFCKDSIKYIPVFGWGIKIMGMVMLKRDWTKDRAKFQALFSLFNGGKLPVYLVSYPEGSRVAPHKLVRSQEYARENKLPVLENILLPRSKGFIATMLGLRGSDVHVLYDMTVVYYHEDRGLNKTWPFWNMFTGRLDGYHLHIHLERIPFDRMPASEDELKAWIFTQFKLKDGLVGSIGKVFRDTFEVKQA